MGFRLGTEGRIEFQQVTGNVEQKKGYLGLREQQDIAWGREALWGRWEEGGLVLSRQRGRSVWMHGHFACTVF